MQTVRQINATATPSDAFWFNRFSSARYNEKNNCRVVIYIMNKYINTFTPKFYPRAFAVKECRNKSNKIYMQINSSFKVCLIIFLKIINISKIKGKILFQIIILQFKRKKFAKIEKTNILNLKNLKICRFFYIKYISFCSKKYNNLFFTSKFTIMKM